LAAGPNKFAQHHPSKATREQVLDLARMGVPHHDMAQVMQISTPTLLKHYRDELDIGRADGNYKIAGKLYSMAMDGNVVACIFWLKCQAKWRDNDKGGEIANEIKVTGGLPD
jgi:hypothetical protein